MRTARYREQVKTGASVETLREITNIDTLVKKSLKQQLRLPSTHRRRIATEAS